MTNNGKARPLAAIVGDRLKIFREQRQLRQSDLATAAAQAGLSWSRSSIAALEAGTRNLTIEELIMLPLVISNAGGLKEPFIPPESLVLLTKHSHVEAGKIFESFATLTAGPIAQHPSAVVVPDVSGEDADEWQTPSVSEDEDWDLGAPPERTGSRYVSGIQWVRDEARDLAFMRVIREVYPDVDLQIVERSYGGDYDLRLKVSRRLEVPAGVIGSVAYIQPFAAGLWGRSFEGERDARAAARGPYPSPRSEQAARGHVTREMIAELNAAIAQAGPVLNPLLAELREVWGDADLLYRWCWKTASSIDATEIAEETLAALPAAGEAIQAARARQLMSVEDLANRAGMAVYWVEWLEAGRPPVTINPSVLRHVVLQAANAVELDGSELAAQLGLAAEEIPSSHPLERGASRKKPSRWRRG
jgi:transcriptional regulator with XRE-family HTH domain